ncbi:TLP18.3, Psb32 and MOLO-1 founding proteins of phosphatase [Promicromonospora umidemergens]|uniref:TPM domain-containing protein n=1 Tax=Promicromonospora umidemergens TaxID=629679 RepID=A0ABP8WST0_9MICO|nr:TLP18.3, Psb32 and MOLO-1 founding proteins of phosphatase [Promicromonospora umidemergens]
MALAGLVGIVLAATAPAPAADATVAAPPEPRPSVSPRLSAAVQAELMSDVLPASPPITITDPVTDGTGALSDTARRGVRVALGRLADESDLRMFVVYIESFDGTEPVDWANASSNQSGLGTEDLLLAIATADREFGLSAPSNVPLTAAELGAIDDAVAAAIEDERWAPAAISAADTVRQSTAATVSPLLVAGTVVGGLLVLATLGYVLWRLVRTRLARLAATSPASGGPTPDELADLSLTELDERAATALVGIDDALKTCEQELGFARAELGADATRDFELILARAAADVRQAFAIRQALDDAAQAEQARLEDAGVDAEPEDTRPDEAGTGPADAARRTRLSRVVALCESAADTLDARTRAFDDLRRLQQRAPDLLADVDAREPEVAGRVATARALLERLADRYPEHTLAMVSGNPEQAELLLVNAKEAVNAGRSVLESGQKAVAVAHARGAQNALGQAVMLLDAVDAIQTHLEEAAGRLDKSIASLTQDVVAARAVEGDFRVTLARTAAQASLKHVEMMREGGDPLAGLQRIAAAEASLDAALADTRDDAEVAARASALLRDTLRRVDEQLRQTADFVATRRGAIGSSARTRLAEAARLGDSARSGQPAGPAAALSEAQRANQLVQEAARLAREDADVAVTATVQPDPDAGTVEENGPITGGMLLGGILLDPNVVRTRRRAPTSRIGGGFGGGGFGGGRPDALRKLGIVRTWWPASAR